jgi:hypothetical protein
MVSSSWPTQHIYNYTPAALRPRKQGQSTTTEIDGAVFVLQLPASRSRAEAAAGCWCRWQPEKVSWNSCFPRIYILSKCRVSQTIVVKVFFIFRFAGRSSCERRLHRRTWISHTTHLAMRSWSSWCRWIQSPRLGELSILQIWRGHLYPVMLLTLLWVCQISRNFVQLINTMNETSRLVWSLYLYQHKRFVCHQLLTKKCSL